jgi:hypothetical protein
MVPRLLAGGGVFYSERDMQNENVFMARKHAKGIKSGTLPTGPHAPKPRRRFKEHKNPSEKERKYQRSVARSKVNLSRNHVPPAIDWSAVAQKWGV